MSRLFVMVAAAWFLTATTAGAQSFDGYASLLVDVLPKARQDGVAKTSVTELRPRIYGDYARDVGTAFRFTVAGFVEGLLGGRGDGSVGAAIARPQELNVEKNWQHADLRVGFSRVSWGRLDEFQPTDVVNPQDLTRFFLEGRTEGRMPAGMIRGRWSPSDAFTLEAIYVPVFRRGRFDQLDEDTAPFNVAPAIPTTLLEPARRLESAQGGVKASATTGRVDWAISAYRGFEPLPVYLPVAPDGSAALRAVGVFPRFTMLGGDFETVKGLWGVRGEIAVFPNRTVQLPNALGAIEGRSLEGGIGVDRQAGNYRVGGTVMVSSRPDRRDVTIVSSVDRGFARETRFVRGFAVYNPREGSAFARVIASASVRENVSIEGSIGWFTGSGFDVLSRFADRDFLYARLKVFF